MRSKCLEFIKVLLIFSFLSCNTFLDSFAAEEEEKEKDRFINTISFFKNSRYSRVEGFFLGFELETIPIKTPSFTFLTRFGYGISDERLEYSFKVEKGINEKNKISLHFIQETGTNDYKIIGNVENSLSALLTKRDFRDYFSLRSGGFEFVHYPSEKFNIDFKFDLKRYKPLYKITDWSIFGEDEFRENPSVVPGKEFYFSVSLNSSFQEFFLMPVNEWRYNIVVEKGSDDFDYFGVGINIKRYQLIYDSQIFVVNLYLHSRTKSIAEQHLIDLGGVSTLRGYAHKEFTGNRIILFNFDYFFGKSILQKLPLNFIPFYDMLDSIFFFDAAKAEIADIDDNIFQGFNNDPVNKFKSNIGIALTLGQGLLRFNFARRLDRKKDNFTFSLRFMRNL